MTLTNIKILALTLRVRIFFFINILTTKLTFLFIHHPWNIREFTPSDNRLAHPDKKIASLVCK